MATQDEQQGFYVKAKANELAQTIARCLYGEQSHAISLFPRQEEMGAIKQALGQLEKDIYCLWMIHSCRRGNFWLEVDRNFCLEGAVVCYNDMADTSYVIPKQPHTKITQEAIRALGFELV